MAGMLVIFLISGCGVSTTHSDVAIQWNAALSTNKTTPTLQIVVNPQLQPGQPLGVAAFKALKALQPDYTRYQLWFPYPKLAVAELQPPTPRSTSWDFSLIDPMMSAFMTATAEHPTVMDFSTIPQWMFVTDSPVVYPAVPAQEMWN